MKKLWNIFASMKTALILMAAIAALFLYGSIDMTIVPAYGDLTFGALLKWMINAPISLSFWLWGSVGLAALLAVSTVACSIESLKKKQGIMLALAPQIIHLGFIFIIIAHLVSSVWGYRMEGYLAYGQQAAAPFAGKNVSVEFTKFKSEKSPGGTTIGWKAWLSFLKDGTIVKEGYMAPNRPVFFNGFGFYLEDVSFKPGPMALIEVSREPGAPWALKGGFLFVAGSVLLLILRIRQE